MVAHPHHSPQPAVFFHHPFREAMPFPQNRASTILQRLAHFQTSDPEGSLPPISRMTSLWWASTWNCTRNVNPKLDPSTNDMAIAIYKSIVGTVGKMTVKTCKNARLGFGPSNKIRSDRFLHCQGTSAADSLGWDSQVSPHLLKVGIAATGQKRSSAPSRFLNPEFHVHTYSLVLANL